MARPIESTPVLKGKDAKAFLHATASVVITSERLEYLRSAAEQSKRAEHPKAK